MSVVAADIPYLGEGLALLTSFIWASAVILFKKSSDTMPPLGLNMFKSVVAVGLALPTVYLLGDLFRPEVWSQVGLRFFLSGVLGVGIGDSLYLASLRLLGAGRSAIVGCLYSPCIILLAFVFLGEALSLFHFIGGALILSSIVLASRQGSEERIPRRHLVLGIIYGAAAVMIMGLSIVWVKVDLKSHPLVWACTVRLAGGVVGLALIGLCLPQRREFWQVFRPHRAWRVALPASFLGAYLAMICWVGGFKYADASIAALLNQTSTVFIVILAAIFLREALTRARAWAVVTATTGSVLVILL